MSCPSYARARSSCLKDRGWLNRWKVAVYTNQVENFPCAMQYKYVRSPSSLDKIKLCFLSFYIKSRHNVMR